MTRVTEYLRTEMLGKIMAGLPVINYIPMIHSLVQQVVIAHAPTEVQAVYADDELRRYLKSTDIEIKFGNEHVSMWSNEETRYVQGLQGNGPLRIQMNDTLDRLPEGSLYRDLLEKLHETRLAHKHVAQQELRDSVRKRLRTNLKAATTFKKLYEILEPELHHYIPKNEVIAQLPACVAPVVDDLRKLGAVLPDTPKAEVKA